MSQQLIRTLLHLAQSDGNVSGSELALIYKIAIEKSLPMFEVEQLIQNPPSELQELQALSEDERFEYIYTMVLMIKMDGKLDQRETELCNHYAESLGYSQKVIPELLNMIESDQQLSSDKSALKSEVSKYQQQ